MMAIAASSRGKSVKSLVYRRRSYPELAVRAASRREWLTVTPVPYPSPVGDATRTGSCYAQRLQELGIASSNGN
ncbi:MAG: hypothetical protein HWQ38_01490 [Nostoc sp. NMS7]|uniref:hypothetical protein n=1 Tax=Nostoc sp. NMS7 TaxID=2815391 RepID=UPI0025E55710|nr:hypothetical protein [Nostoc sp. NMS7]MBN3945219.1 hypothetical protein [Nostoc sp. NMS7]